MDTNQPTVTISTPAPAPVSPASPGIFGTKIPSSVAFAVGVLLFLLPLSEIKCGSQTIAKKSGLDFALANEWKMSMGNGMLNDNDLGKKSMSAGKEQKGNTQYFAMAALAIGVIGLVLCFANSKLANGMGMVSGLLAVGAMIGLMLDEKKNFAASMRQQALDKAEKGADNLGLDNIGNTMNDIKPTLAFTPWFYIAVIAFLAAAFFCYKRMQSSKT